MPKKAKTGPASLANAWRSYSAILGIFMSYFEILGTFMSYFEIFSSRIVSRGVAAVTFHLFSKRQQMIIMTHPLDQIINMVSVKVLNI